MKGHLQGGGLKPFSCARFHNHLCSIVSSARMSCMRPFSLNHMYVHFRKTLDLKCRMVSTQPFMKEALGVGGEMPHTLPFKAFVGRMRVRCVRCVGMGLYRRE